MVRPFTRIGSCRHEVALLNEAVGGKIDRSLVPRREPATHAVSLVPAHDVSGFLTSSGLRPVGRDVGEHDGGPVPSGTVASDSEPSPWSASSVPSIHAARFPRTSR